MRKTSPLYLTTVPCLLAALVGCVHAPPPLLPLSPEEEQILDWEDRRSLGEGRLPAMATAAPSAALRVRALRALARIQEPSTLQPVLAALADPEPSVRDEAAFAAEVLALSWQPLSEEEKARLGRGLLAAEQAEADAGVRRTLLAALGRLATAEAVARLEERVGHQSPEVASTAALALGVAVRRGAVLKALPVAPLATLLSAHQPEPVRHGAAYLLAHARRREALPLLRSCLGDEAPDVRALCIKGMGELGGPEDSVVAGRLLQDTVPRVAAEAARTLAKLAAGCSGDCVAMDELQALAPRAARVAAGQWAEGHALLALAQQGLPEPGRPVLESLRRAVQQAQRGAAGVSAEELGWLDCRLAAALDRQRGRLEEVVGCGGGQVPEERRLALGLREVAQARGPEGAEQAVAWLRHPVAQVRLAALGAVSARPVPQAAEPVRALLESQDTAEAAAAASAAAALKDEQALPALQALAARVAQEPDLAESLAGALVALAGPQAEPVLRPWLQHPHANVRHVAARALSELTSNPVRAPHVERLEAAARPPRAPAGATLTFRTRKGEFTVALDSEQAPLTAGNLYTLARRGYFHGLTFHRVVPDFVAQGGDPQGTGEGGPGYSIRCEVSRRPYRRGTLGMALGGKDTGGSQFFFTHSPQPHLEGRYTAFGEVVRGMEVVDSLTEGEPLLEVLASP